MVSRCASFVRIDSNSRWVKVTVFRECSASSYASQALCLCRKAFTFVLGLEGKLGKARGGFEIGSNRLDLKGIEFLYGAELSGHGSGILTHFYNCFPPDFAAGMSKSTWMSAENVGHCGGAAKPKTTGCPEIAYVATRRYPAPGLRNSIRKRCGCKNKRPVDSQHRTGSRPSRWPEEYSNCERLRTTRISAPGIQAAATFQSQVPRKSPGS